MAQETNIGWTDATWNVAVGCTKVSEACKNCYMIRDMGRKPMWKDAHKTVTRTKSVFTSPLKWKKPLRVFTSSLTDLFHEQIDDYRWEAFDIMRRCPHHQFQILTKRPERLIKALSEAYQEALKRGMVDLAGWLKAWLNNSPPENVWFGVSIGCLNELWRIDWLETLPAAVKYVSFEPLLELIPNAYRPYVDWIIIGGESGPATGKWAARPCHTEWMTDLIEQYTNVEYPVSAIFVKQMGSVLARQLQLKHPKGEDLTEWPAVLQRQEFPRPRFTLPGQQIKLPING